MIFLLLIIAIITFLYYHFVHKRRGLPPGPTPYPILGNTLDILKNPPGEAVFKKWRKQYGDVYTYWMGN
jgi:cytochrome P450 family 33